MCTKNVKCILEKIYSKSNKRAIKEECEIYISRLDDMSLVYIKKVLEHDNKKFQEIGNCLPITTPNSYLFECFADKYSYIEIKEVLMVHKLIKNLLNI